MVLKEINSPNDIKKLSLEDLGELSRQIRNFIIEVVSKTGGHIGANLATIELTLAIHYIFDSPKDPIIFDTGHQGYTQKIITGRAELFKTLNKYKGLSRFLTRAESAHDTIDASHAGTSLATAAGIAHNFKKTGRNRKVICVVGDGSLVEGVAFEGLNYIGGSNLPIVIALNDNEMAIAPNVGGIKHLTQGKNWSIKSRKFFEGLGLKYLAVKDGHSFEELIKAFKEAKINKVPTIVHVKTEKGKGLPIAKKHPYKMHFSMPFDPITGKGASPSLVGESYSTVLAAELGNILKNDKKIVIITPATPYASGLDSLIEKYPNRIIDVGMAEQHAISMAAGLALSGLKPIVCFQTTFMQRSFDQLIHDVAFMNLPVTILGARSGFAGYDGPTHHGIFDIPYLRSIPNLKIKYPADSHDAREMIKQRVKKLQGPMIILHPYDLILKPEPKSLKRSMGAVIFSRGKDGTIYCIGNSLSQAKEVNALLHNLYSVSFSIVCITDLKPLPQKFLLKNLINDKKIVTLEEGTLKGGFGSALSELITDKDLKVSLLRIGVEDKFISAGNKDECSKEAGMDPKSIALKILNKWPEISKNSLTYKND